jgi:hypothetical protein
MKQPSYVGFEPSTYKWRSDVNYKDNPHLYYIGKGQQGVLTCEPYKSEICQYWRFKTPEIAIESSTKILEMFYEYLNDGDFVGADMAKKFLHMGYTRSRRYANHPSGRKWQKVTNKWEILPLADDRMESDKARSADIFYVAWKEARENEQYLKLKKIHRSKYEK